jgi:hypothetical protein
MSDSGKIGSGHAAAMARMGLAELRGALYPESNVAARQEHGLYGTSTPQEVVDAKRPVGDDRERQAPAAEAGPQADAAALREQEAGSQPTGSPVQEHLRAAEAAREEPSLTKDMERE